jgi:hypothetical protein
MHGGGDIGMDISKSVKVIEGKLCLSSTAICEVLDIHRNTLQNYTKAGLPKVKTGWFDLREVIRWRAEREGAKASGEDESHANETPVRSRVEAGTGGSCHIVKCHYKW